MGLEKKGWTKVRKRLVAACFGTLAFVLPAPGAHAAGGTFTDDDSSYAEASIEALVAAGITAGTSPGAFSPTALVTRAEMAVFLARALELPAGAPDRFADDEGHFAEDAINGLAENGIASGCAGGLYCPNHPLSRQEMAALLVRTLDLLGLPTARTTSVSQFTDTGQSFAAEAIEVIAAYGI